MIYGIGTDIVEIDRMEAALRRSDHFFRRCFTEGEQVFLEGRGKRKAQGAAMNFAGKEAVAKALRTGFGQDVRIDQIEILREPAGAPYVVLYGETLQYARRCGVDRFHISLSDTRDLAAAYVVAEKGEKKEAYRKRTHPFPIKAITLRKGAKRCSISQTAGRRRRSTGSLYRISGSHRWY